MMLTATKVKDYLKTIHPAVTIFAGTIDKNNKQCLGVYPRGRSLSKVAIGGIDQTSTWTLPITVLVHWTESTEACEEMASSLYEHFLTHDGVEIGGFHIVRFGLLDSSPVDLSRDDKGVCEMVVRMNIMYQSRFTQ